MIVGDFVSHSGLICGYRDPKMFNNITKINKFVAELGLKISFKETVSFE